MDIALVRCMDVQCNRAERRVAGGFEDGGLGDMRQTQPAELDRRMRCEQAGRATGGD